MNVSRIIQLAATNVLRLKAIKITPKQDEHVISIGGRNGAGKSSVLNAIAMAIGGKTLIPEEPLRSGETEGSISVNLGDYIVTRTFKRDKIHAEDCASRIVHLSGAQTVEQMPKKAECNCTPSFSETRSYLTIKNHEGATYPSPQTILDKLHGKLTFDPQAFLQLDPKAREEMLRRLVGLDTSSFDKQRSEAYSERTRLNRTLREKEALLDAHPFYEKDTPSEELSSDAVKAAMQEADAKRQRVADLTRDRDAQQRRSFQLDADMTRSRERSADIERKIKELQQQLTEEEQRMTSLQTQKAESDSAHSALSAQIETAQNEIPDTKELTQQLDDIELTNRRVRSNVARAALAAEVAALQEQVKTQTDLIAATDDAKRAALESAQFPVPGLGISDNGVTFNGIPFAQASTAEQLRVSVAIGLALNPTLKIMLIRNGNALDEDSIALLEQMATEADAQVWMEYVTKDAGDVSVLIEEGEVAAS